jgi:branched-chain amino acid transport system permease protein
MMRKRRAQAGSGSDHRPKEHARTPSLRAGRIGASLPWVVVAGLLAAPLTFVHSSGLFAYLAQACAMIVFALSYNLLLGETGLLSFGHAAYAGLGAFAAAHLFNRGGIALPWLPLAGGAAGAAFGMLFGAVATRRAGTAFAMITLGIGELVAAAVWTLPEGFGGAAGVSIDRGSGPSWGAWTFGAPREAYVVIACWTVVSMLAMFALGRTPLARMAHAVRENAPRVEALGIDPRCIRLAMFTLGAFFAGVAGTLTLVDVELASSESVAMTRSGAVLIATVIGGSSTFFGPVLGALVLTGMSVALAGVTRAWPAYLGLLFVAVVLRAPAGIVGWWGAPRTRVERDGIRVAARTHGLGALAAAAWLAALVILVETLYARRFAADAGGAWYLGAFAFDIGVPSTWSILGVLIVVGAVATRCARRARRRACARANGGVQR